jgi:hypothetical protein
MRVHPALLAPSVMALVLSACTAHHSVPAATATAPTLQGDAAHPASTHGWVDTRLYFGLGMIDKPEQGISEAEWRDFLDREVTPRFPAGLSVVDVYGQWQSKDAAAPSHLRSKMIIIDYPDSQENRDKIEAIRAAWKARTHQQSVMRVTQPADISF